MLLIVLALFWVALLAPIVVRRLRDGGTEKSIQSFRAEHEVLSRQDYAIIPAHRLDQPDQPVSSSRLSERKPRLTVVHADDTFGSIESRSSWDEWSDDYAYEYDDTARPVTGVSNRYAQAYSSRPSGPVATTRYQTPIRRRTMRSQRRMMFTRLVLVAVVLTLLAFYSVSQGYLNDSSLPVRVPERRPLATIEPLYSQGRERYAAHYEDEFESGFYEPEADDQWGRQPQPRRALG